MNPPHAIASTKTEDLIRDLFGRGYHVRVQKPMVFGLSIDPEPDVAVVRGRPADYTSHPTTAALIVEVSDTSLKYDTTTKVGLYAEAGHPEYWVLDLKHRTLSIYRNPVRLPNGECDYLTRLTAGEADSIAPLAAPHAAIRIADLLP